MDVLFAAVFTALFSWATPLLLLVFFLLYSSVVYVPNSRVGIRERLWSLSGSVKSGLIALNGEAGFEPDLLRGGIHFLTPFMYRVRKADLVLIPQGEIGYVFARDGVALTPSQALAANHHAKNFEDVREFLQTGGQKGPQRKVLREGVYAVNTAQFVVITKGVTYALGLSRGDEAAIDAMKSDIVKREGFTPLVIDSVKDEIGVLTVHDGPGLPTGELIAPVVGQDNGRSKHDNFQDPEAFLACGGSRGRQHQVLADGTYYINRLFATVDMIPKTVIAMGMAGVVISYTGRSGADLSGEDYQHGELVRPSERGVWETPLLPGKYAFNTFSGKVIEVPTTNFILKWESGNSGSKFDQNLKEVSLITKDAFEPTLPLSVVVHIDYKKAARVVQRFGNIQQLVEQTLDPMVSAYFKNTAQTKTLIELLQERTDVQTRALADMRAKFAEYNLELQEVLIGTPRSPVGHTQIEVILAQLRDREIARERIETYERQQEAAIKKRTLREAEAVSAQQRGLTESKIAIDIAENNDQAEVKQLSRQGEAEAARSVRVAMADAGRIKAIGAANANRIELKGAATALTAKAQVEAFGGAEIRLAQEIATQITNAVAKSGMPVVPSAVVGSSLNGDGNAIDAIAAMVLSGQSLGRNMTAARVEGGLRN